MLDVYNDPRRFMGTNGDATILIMHEDDAAPREFTGLAYYMALDSVMLFSEQDAELRALPRTGLFDIFVVQGDYTIYYGNIRRKGPITLENEGEYTGYKQLFDSGLILHTYIQNKKE